MPLQIDLNIQNIDVAFELCKTPEVDFNSRENRGNALDKASIEKSSILQNEDASDADAEEENDEQNVFSGLSQDAIILPQGTENHLNSHDDILNDDTPINDGLDTNIIVEDETQPSLRKRKFLSNEQRLAVSAILQNSCSGGKLNLRTAKRVATLHGVSTDVIYRIWKQQKQTGDVCHKKTKNCGRKRIEFDADIIRQVPLSKRVTLRALSCSTGIDKKRLIKYLKEGAIRRHSNTLKPYLKEENMKSRLKFCLSMLEETSMPHDPKFKSMHNVVHIDEKWFYMTQKSINYYLLANEDEPHRTCQNKNFIGKVMFLVAVARPRFDSEGNEIFSGKIGVFPLVTKVPAKRNSINRAAGTLETKPIASITKEVNRMFLVNKVLPAIKEKWPREDIQYPIFIQQDNARCHVQVDDEEFCRVAQEDGFDIRLTCQPPNSPDLNVLDLGFFNAIQSLQQQEVAKSVDELIQAVEKSFDSFSSENSNKIFLTLQACMIEIMKLKGSNRYKIPHIKKDMLVNHGSLPNELKCDRQLIEEVMKCLQNSDN